MQDLINQSASFASIEGPRPAMTSSTAAAAAEQSAADDQSRQYHPTAEQLKVRKHRHRRTGSHGSGNFNYVEQQQISPRTSPNRERRVSCHGTPRLAQKAATSPQQQQHSPGSGSRIDHNLPLNPASFLLYDDNNVNCDDDANNINLRRDSCTTSSGEECQMVTAEEAAHDDHLETLDRKISDIMNRGDLSRSNSDKYGPLSFSYKSNNGSGGSRRRKRSDKISPGSARRLANNNARNSPGGGGSDAVRFEEDVDDGGGESTDSRDEEECSRTAAAAVVVSANPASSAAATTSSVLWSDDADDSDEDNPRFKLRRRR